MPFTITLMEHKEKGTPYPYWLKVIGADHIEDDEIVQVLTETFGPGGGKFPSLDSCWGHKQDQGYKVLMFRYLEDRMLARLRIT